MQDPKLRIQMLHDRNAGTVKVGDRVLFGRDDQHEVEVQGSTCRHVERELHAVASEGTEHGTGLYL